MLRLACPTAHLSAQRLFTRGAKLLQHNLGQGLSLLLVIALLASSAPAAPVVLTDTVSTWHSGLAFWLKTSGWALAAKNFLLQGNGQNNRAQERQEDRDAKVSRLQIYPGDVTLHVGERVNFAAIAYDSDNVPVSGVHTHWAAQDGQSHPAKRISQRGEFAPLSAGQFIVSAQGAGHRAQVTVTVIDAPHLPHNPPDGAKALSVQQVTNRTPPPQLNASQLSASRSKRGAGHSHGSKTGRASASALAHAWHTGVAPLLQGGGSGGWDDSNYWSSSDPDNGVGSTPGTPVAGGAGSANFQVAASVLSLSGRGISLSLGLAYNSRMWNKANTQMTYDIDRGWPAPGWSLGFGKLLSMGSQGSMLVDADGTRHSYAGTLYNWGYATHFVGHTTDGTFIDYTCNVYTDGSMGGSAQLPNGTTINYGVYGPGAAYPTSIEEANGNYLTITYINNSGPQIQTITDTVGRTINFSYDSNNLLTAITAPGLSGSSNNPRTLVRLHYHQLALGYAFAWPQIQSIVVRNSYPWVLDAIYYPATSTGYWFGDSDSYSSYGMLAKVVEERGMGFSGAPVNQMGTVTQGQVSRTETYNYPMTANSSLTDAPTYTTMVESWAHDNNPSTPFDSATTSYNVNENGNPRTITITMPNGTKSTQQSYNAPGQWYDGLVYYDETDDSNNNRLQSSTTSWQQGDYGSPRPQSVSTTDERTQTTGTEFSYAASPSYNRLIETRSYDYGYVFQGTNNHLLRKTDVQYETSTSYINKHIFNLPTVVEVYDANNNRVSRTEYQHDGQTLMDAPGVTMHDEAYNPYTTETTDVCCDWEWDPYTDSEYCAAWCPQSVYDPNTNYRGNVTQIKEYADAVNLDNTTAVVETHQYDITGNMVLATTACCQQTSVSYTSATQYAYPLSQTRGAATDTSAQLTTSATYDVNTGLTLSATDANGLTTNTSYYADTLRPQSVTLPTYAHTDYAYDEVGMSVTVTTYSLPGSSQSAIADQNIKLLNGHGQVRIEKALAPNSAWDVVETQYDAMGRIVKQSRPYRSGTETPQWNVTNYDAIGRMISVQAPDGTNPQNGSLMQVFYNETSRPDVASTNPGQTTRVVDAWGRERWGRKDAFGRVVEIIEPNPDGNGAVATGGLQTTYSYNVLDKLTGVTQGNQTRSFNYDSLGRLTQQKLAEQSATLTSAGLYVGVGGAGAQWSDVFTYDTRSNLTSRTDARGVKTTYNYNNDPLNRLSSVHYDLTGAHESLANSPIAPVSDITYSYETTGDVTRLHSVTSGAGSETYAYGDTEKRLTSVATVVNGRSPFYLDYEYDALDRVTKVTYPNEYGMTGAPRKDVQPSYDAASRLSGLQVGSVSYASGITYNAASQPTTLQVGPANSYQTTENYIYDPKTGLLQHQDVVHATQGTILSLDYSYLRSGTTTGRTGQLTSITNNVDTSNNKNRSYEYDALGRLKRAVGGNNGTWVQRYVYDRYGNRANTYSQKTVDFVANLYIVILNRQADSGGLQAWTNYMNDVYAQGQTQFLSAAQTTVAGFFGSQEYINRNRSNSDYVTDLYWAYLNRAPDQSGLNAWTNALNNGATRDSVLQGFAQSTEFANHVAGLYPSVSNYGAIPVDGRGGMTYDVTTNRVNAAGWEYDAAGNQTRALSPAGVWQRYDYDAAGRLVHVKDDNNNIISTITYGDTNQRLIVEEGGWRTYYVWDSESVVAEYSESSTSTSPQWSKSYVYLGARLLATLTPSGSTEAVQYQHPDRLGTRLITDSIDAGYAEQSTLPYGVALTAESTVASNRRFTNYDRSSTTGLDYAMNRDYDAQQGRFTRSDPIGMVAVNFSDPQTLNLYTYCGNDPINQTDPDGLFFGGLFKWINKIFKWVAIALTVAVVVVLAAITFGGAIPLIGSFVFKAGLWALTHILIPLSHIPILGSFIGLGAIGTPSWNPNGNGFGFGYSLQEQGGNYCSPEQGCHVELTINVVDKLPDAAWYARFWHTLKRIDSRLADYNFRYIMPFTFGAADTLTEVPGTGLSWTALLRKVAWSPEAEQRMTSSWAYKGGELYGIGNSIVAGGELEGVAGRVALDTAPHPFPRFGGRWSHLQLDLWRDGVKGSNFVEIHIPLFRNLNRSWQWAKKFKL